MPHAEVEVVLSGAELVTTLQLVGKGIAFRAYMHQDEHERKFLDDSPAGKLNSLGQGLAQCDDPRQAVGFLQEISRFDLDSIHLGHELRPVVEYCGALAETLTRAVDAVPA